MNSVKDLLTHPFTVRLSQIVIGALFVVAALGKLGNLRAFAGQIHGFDMMPVAIENGVAFSLPWIELVAGLALIVGFRARAGALVVAVLMAVFTVAVGAAMARGLEIDCGCFGSAEQNAVGPAKLLENLGMLTLACLALVRPATARAPVRGDQPAF